MSTAALSMEQFLQERRTGIGGSDAAAIVGLSRWNSPMSIYLEKVGEAPEDSGASEAAYWGTVLEDVVAREFMRRTDMKVRRDRRMLRSKDHPFMIAHLDRRVVGGGILECKTASAYKASEWSDGGIPDEYALQVQHYLAVTGEAEAWIAVLLGGNRFEHRHIERDEALIGNLIKIEGDFWRLVENRTPPAIDDSDATSEVLKLIYPEATEDVIPLPSEAQRWIAQRDEAKDDIERAESLKKEAESNLKALLGDAKEGHVGRYKVSWSNVTSRKLDSKRLKSDRPDIYESFSKESSYRRFMVKEVS